MNFNKTKFLIILALLIVFGSFLVAKSVSSSSGGKKLDLTKYHSVGNIWLRVSNYGFFGSGDDIIPQYPSLEYPGGSGIDYLYQGALWFGAKKIRRRSLDNARLFWAEDPSENADDTIVEGDIEAGWPNVWPDTLHPILDTLVTVGFDGDADVMEFLPAYNPQETSALGDQYQTYNTFDNILTASIRNHRTGIDDDGDGLIDEDPAGYSFPFRDASIIPEELPAAFRDYSGMWLHELATGELQIVLDGLTNDIWFPLGFLDLSDSTNTLFNFAQANDDDADGLMDEDGYPVSEQDFISYYYDYSPFGTAGDRTWTPGGWSNVHKELNVRVRQMSYQWSYEHIKNLCYLEFDITNMNAVDTLFDCTMGIYMDSDVGPQAWNSVYSDDVSSYVGAPYEFAYTYDEDQDGGLTTGYVGSRVCSPDPDSLEFACWTWEVGDGPDDADPLNYDANGITTANEKYYLLTDRNPNESNFTSLRDFPNTQIGNPVDTRYLFAFYGAQPHTGDTDGNGLDDYTEQNADGVYYKRWDLAPGRMMKIVIAVFPGDSVLELQQTAVHAKDTYGIAQTLTTVVLPDTFKHYTPPNPPEIPMTFVKLENDGNRIDVYWDNRSQMDNVDDKTVKSEQIGWQNTIGYLDSHTSNDSVSVPEMFNEANWNGGVHNDEAFVNPWTGFRLRHDFQGYTLWGRSGSGSQEFWGQKGRWDIPETEQDLADYQVNEGHAEHLDFSGELGNDIGLPGPAYFAVDGDSLYYRFNDLYDLVPYEAGDPVNGYPLFDPNKDFAAYEANQAEITSWSHTDQSLWFKNSDPAFPTISDELFLELYDDKLIFISGHGGQSAAMDIPGEMYNSTEKLEMQRKDRLSRRYYKASINNPPKGIEYYIAVSSWDRGIPELNIPSLESGRDSDANMKVIFPGPGADEDMDNIIVTPNPYIGHSDFDGRRENDDKGDKSRRIWFVNLPSEATIKIFTLAGDLVDEIDHNGFDETDVISVSKAAYHGLASDGIASWDLLSKHDQIIAPGIYLFSVKNKANDEIKVGKFVIIK